MSKKSNSNEEFTPNSIANLRNVGVKLAELEFAVHACENKKFCESVQKNLDTIRNKLSRGAVGISKKELTMSLGISTAPAYEE